MNRPASTEYETRVDEHAVRLIAVSTITTLAISLSLGLMVIGPMYAFLIHGEYATATGVILPFIDPDSVKGYACNVAIQLITALAGLVGLIATEMASSIVNNTYTMLADLVCFNMVTFSDGLNVRAFEFRHKMELRNIFVQLQDLEVYLDEVNDIYYWKFFLQPILTTGCVALGILAEMLVG